MITPKERKRNKARGDDFEKRTRKDLEEKGWIVDRFTNNVEWPESNINLPSEERTGKLVPARPKYAYNPRLKQRMQVRGNTGFPDFIAFRWGCSQDCMEKDLECTDSCRNWKWKMHEVIGVECKVGKYLSKEEKEKCEWLLKNKIFSKILVAYKEKTKNRVYVRYKEFEGGEDGTKKST